MAAEPEGIRQARFTQPPGSTRVLLIRHGESAPTHPDRPFPLTDGHGDPPLHTVGEVQAQRLADRLVAEEVIDAMYVTTLQRTHQTAAPTATRLGLTPAVEPDLREVFLGEWEGGLLRVKAATGDPLFTEVIERQRWDVIPGAEPQVAFEQRIQASLARIAIGHPDQTVAAFVHGGVIGQALATATGVAGFAFAGADNASISEIVLHGGRQTLRRFNDCAHLHGLA